MDAQYYIVIRNGVHQDRPDSLGEITQEEEEEALRREIMQRDNEIYKIYDEDEDEWVSSEMEELLIRAA